MNDVWDEKRKAAEEQYFQKQNEAALARLQQRKDEVRNSPITGKPMEQMTLMGITVDRCKDSGGIWFDAGELDELLKHVRDENTNTVGFLSKLFSRKI